MGDPQREQHQPAGLPDRAGASERPVRRGSVEILTYQPRASLAGARASWKGAAPGVEPAVLELARLLKPHVGGLKYVAQRAGVSQHTIMGWLRRRKNPTVASLRAVLTVLGYDLKITRRGNS